jgi:hypothetical protein
VQGTATDQTGGGTYDFEGTATWPVHHRVVQDWPVHITVYTINGEDGSRYVFYQRHWAYYAGVPLGHVAWLAVGPVDYFVEGGKIRVRQYDGKKHKQKVEKFELIEVAQPDPAAQEARALERDFNAFIKSHPVPVGEMRYVVVTVDSVNSFLSPSCAGTPCNGYLAAAHDDSFTYMLSCLAHYNGDTASDKAYNESDDAKACQSVSLKKWVAKTDGKNFYFLSGPDMIDAKYWVINGEKR